MDEPSSQHRSRKMNGPFLAKEAIESGTSCNKSRVFYTFGQFRNQELDIINWFRDLDIKFYKRIYHQWRGKTSPRSTAPSPRRLDLSEQSILFTFGLGGPERDQWGVADRQNVYNFWRFKLIASLNREQTLDSIYRKNLALSVFLQECSFCGILQASFTCITLL